MPAEEVQLRLIHLLVGARLGQVGSAVLQAAQNTTLCDAAPPTAPGSDLLLKAFTGSQKKDMLQGLLQESLKNFAARVRRLLAALRPKSIFLRIGMLSLSFTNLAANQEMGMHMAEPSRGQGKDCTPLLPGSFWATKMC